MRSGREDVFGRRAAALPGLLVAVLLGGCGGDSAGEGEGVEGEARNARELSAFDPTISEAEGAGGADDTRITKRRLGPGVNTAYAELLPIVLAGADTLYFTRAGYPDPTFRRLIEQQFDERIEACRSVDTGTMRDLAREAGHELTDEQRAMLGRLSADCERLEALRERELHNFERSPHPNQVYMSVRRPDGTWSDSRRLPAPLNDETLSNVGNISITSATPDRRTLLVMGDLMFGRQRVDRCLDLATTLGLDAPHCLPVAIARAESEGWSRGDRLRTEPTELRLVVTGAALAPDGRTIVLAAGPGSGHVDDHQGLWVTRLDEEAELWSVPVELPALNGPFENVSPFLGPDGRTLYFASDRPGGEGGFDLYVSRRMGDGWVEWSDPENLGADVNSAWNDVSMSVDGSGRYAFMAAGKEGQLDIYEFHLPPNLSPAPTAVVGGRILLLGVSEADTAGLRMIDGGGDLLLPPAGGGAAGGGGAGAAGGGTSVTFVRLSDATVAARAGFDPATGSFEARLPTGARYAAYVTAPGFAGIGQVVDLGTARPDQELTHDLEVARLEVGAEIRLNNVFFDSDSASLRPESRAELDRLRLILRSHPDMRIEIAGHTDSQRSEAYNLDLSDRRAAAVRAYIEDLGIDQSRLESKGYGEGRPVASNDTPEGRELNRRVAFRILRL